MEGGASIGIGADTDTSWTKLKHYFTIGED